MPCVWKAMISVPVHRRLRLVRNERSGRNVQVVPVVDVQTACPAITNSEPVQTTPLTNAVVLPEGGGRTRLVQVIPLVELKTAPSPMATRVVPLNDTPKK